MTMTAFWDIGPNPSETSAYFNETTWRCVLEGYIVTRRREKLKSLTATLFCVFMCFVWFSA
jgi:hypothetical protein